ncbi:Crp/Fnr family transcriptional regulator [Bacteroidota bacterium]|nr:Crp/Fnr family transcriptional regulator [Bacteroidota bacterium]
MTSLSSQQLMDVFPIFTADLAEFIHQNGESKVFKPGEVLMKPGQFFKYAMLIVNGKVKLYREGEKGEEFFMYFLERGEACALSMLCMARSQSSTVMAVPVEETEVIMIPIQFMDSLMKSYTSWYHFVIENYRSRFEELLTVVDQIAFKNMDERLEWYLSRQAAAFGNELNLTHQQIAHDINSSREVVSRLLKKLEKIGRVKMERNTIHWIEEKSI